MAGGTGTRLMPLTLAINKQLLPVYDKPMIYYPLTTLMLAGVRQVLVITNPDGVSVFRSLLGDGHQWGMDLDFVAQTEPRGIADGFRVGKEFLTNHPSALILGDNVFQGHGLSELLHRISRTTTGATILSYRVRDPQHYAVVEVDGHGNPLSLVEKPDRPTSNLAVTGLYYYDSNATEYAAELRPSVRGELEITDLNRMYLDRGQLTVENLTRGFAWLDAGTHSSLHQAANFIQTVQARQGMYVASPDEIAFRLGWIATEDLQRLAKRNGDSEYGRYLHDLALGSERESN